MFLGSGFDRICCEWWQGPKNYSYIDQYWKLKTLGLFFRNILSFALPFEHCHYKVSSVSLNKIFIHYNNKGTIQYWSYRNLKLQDSLFDKIVVLHLGVWAAYYLELFTVLSKRVNTKFKSSCWYELILYCNWSSRLPFI